MYAIRSYYAFFRADTTGAHVAVLAGQAELAKFTMRRITSYNVCYTKLLRNDEQLIQLITVTMGGYYRGFVGHELRGDKMPFDVQNLAQRIIEEMGVDRHMEEILRIVDQNRMTAREFSQFLIDRGFSVRQRNNFV